MPTVIRDAAAPTATTRAPRALVRGEGEFARVTMDMPERRNALSLDHMRQLPAAVRQVAASDARGVLLAPKGLSSAPVTTSATWSRLTCPRYASCSRSARSS